jgi:hypothetical protein
MTDPAEEARQSVARVGQLKARLTGKHAARVFLIALALGAIGLIAAFLFYYAGRSLVLLLCALLLLPAAVLIASTTLFKYFGRQPALLLDAQGLHHSLLGSVAWDDVVGISLVAIGGRGEAVPVLALGLAPDVRVRSALPWSVARGGILRIPLQGLSESPAPILAMAEVLRDRHVSPRLQAWHPGMSAASVAAQFENQRLLAGFERLAANAGGHDAGEEAELGRLSRELDANVAAIRQSRAADLKQLRLRFGMLVLGLGLLLLVGGWRLWTLAH